MQQSRRLERGRRGKRRGMGGEEESKSCGRGAHVTSAENARGRRRRRWRWRRRRRNRTGGDDRRGRLVGPHLITLISPRPRFYRKHQPMAQRHLRPRSRQLQHLNDSGMRTTPNATWFGLSGAEKLDAMCASPISLAAEDASPLDILACAPSLCGSFTVAYSPPAGT